MITYQELEGVRNANAKLSNDMRNKITEVIERVGTSDPDALKAAIVGELAPVMEMADTIASEMAAALYNGWRYSALGLTTETVTESAYDAGKIEAMANTAAMKAREGADIEQIINIVSGRAGYDMRKSYGNTMIANAGRDTHRARFARIPGPSMHYSGGCPFCRMLASRGFVYWNKKTAGEFDHYHADCTCEVVAQFDKNPRVEGYNPDDYLEEYLDARAYAKDNRQYLRESQSVTTKEGARYRYGTRVGNRHEMEYGEAKHVTANDISGAYNRLGIANIQTEKKAIGATRSKLYEAYVDRVSDSSLNSINNKQLDHIFGTKQFENNRKSRLAARNREPSYFTLSFDETVSLINRHVGHGTPLMERNSDGWSGTELCIDEDFVGAVVAKDGRILQTRCFKIHYGDKSIHAVPMYDEGGAPDDIR